VIWGSTTPWSNSYAVIWGSNVVWTDPQSWSTAVIWGSNSIGTTDGTAVIWGSTGGLNAAECSVEGSRRNGHRRTVTARGEEPDRPPRVVSAAAIAA
jgi:hypothetical protein